jgi:hypothetical protein
MEAIESLPGVSSFLMNIADFIGLGNKPCLIIDGIERLTGTIND